MAIYMNADSVTSVLKRAIDILFVQNPKGTSLGALTGVVARTVLDVLSPSLQRFTSVMTFSQVGVYQCMVAGIVVFNVPHLFKRRRLPKEIEDAFETIRRSKPHLSKVQLRMQYLALCGNVVEKAQLPQSRFDPRAPA